MSRFLSPSHFYIFRLNSLRQLGAARNFPRTSGGRGFVIICLLTSSPVLCSQSLNTVWLKLGRWQQATTPNHSLLGEPLSSRSALNYYEREFGVDGKRLFLESALLLKSEDVFRTLSDAFLFLYSTWKCMEETKKRTFIFNELDNAQLFIC